jgi:hypothetical protein
LKPELKSKIQAADDEVLVVRIKLSRTLRAIDSWKDRVDHGRHKYIGMLSLLLTALEVAKPSSAVISLFIVGASINFAFAQAGLLIFLGLLLLKLQFYRFANLFLRITPTIPL